jgi:hypothetical protein
MDRSRLGPWTRTVLFAMATVCLLSLSAYRSYSLGQYRTMYDNPIYRWRESIAVALSELRDMPLHGYVAYRSIRDHLTQHGLALMAGEASPLPTAAELRALVYDPDRLEALFQEASAVPVDYSLPPVALAGSEKGEIDFYYWAFRLFGINLAGLWKLYFLLLALSVSLFFAAHWRSPGGLMLLMLYLIGHYYLVGYSSTTYFQAVHNSRFFPVLSLLPAMHLLLLLLRREPPTGAGVIMAGGQTFLLFFLIFCRDQAIWQPIAILATAALVVPIRPIWQARRSRHALGEALRAASAIAWPAMIVIVGFGGLAVYQRLAFDPHAYATETRAHTFWEPLYSGTVSASPELGALYLDGDEAYSDSMTYMAVLRYLRERNDASPAIVEVANGIININAMKNMGVYDDLVRNLFLTMLRKHPWLVLKSFAFDKPIDQLIILWHARLLAYVDLPWVLSLILGTWMFARYIDALKPGREDVLAVVRASALVALLSLSTTEVFPTPMIPDTLLIFIVLLPITVAYVLAAAARSQSLGLRT